MPAYLFLYVMMGATYADYVPNLDACIQSMLNRGYGRCVEHCVSRCTGAGRIGGSVSGVGSMPGPATKATKKH